MTTRLWPFVAGALAASAVLLLFTAASVVFCEGTLRVGRPGYRSEAPPTERHPNARWQTVNVQARDRITLKGWFVTPNGSSGRRCVMVLHGISDSKSGAAGFAAMFLDSGYAVLLPDNRAHGDSGGQFVTYGLLEKLDVLDWARWLGNAGCTEIYGLGESLGASVLIQASAEAPVFRAIVAECAYADLRAIAVSRARQVIGGPELMSEPVSEAIVAGAMVVARIRYGLDFRLVTPTSAIARSKTPILLIHGTKDGRTPCWHSQQLARANRYAVLWLVPGADHVAAYSVDPEGFRSRVLAWFSRG